jgi:hypothetical protein
MRDEPPDHRDGGWVGESALILGVAALVGAMLPVVSDYVAGPVAAVAILLGLLGARRHQAGRARRVAPAIAGTVLGAVALFVVVLMLAASRS